MIKDAHSFIRHADAISEKNTSSDREITMINDRKKSLFLLEGPVQLSKVDCSSSISLKIGGGGTRPSVLHDQRFPQRFSESLCDTITVVPQNKGIRSENSSIHYAKRMKAVGISGSDGMRCDYVTSWWYS